MKTNQTTLYASAVLIDTAEVLFECEVSFLFFAFHSTIGERSSVVGLAHGTKHLWRGRSAS